MYNPPCLTMCWLAWGVCGTGTYPSSIDSVTESDVSSLSSAIWKTGVTVASVGDVSGVPKKSALA